MMREALGVLLISRLTGWGGIKSAVVLAVMVWIGCCGMLGFAAGASKQSQPSELTVYEGVLRIRVQRHKELVFSAKNKLFYLCDDTVKRSLRRYTLFTLRVLGEPKPLPLVSRFVGQCLDIHDIEFISTPQKTPVVSGFMAKAAKDNELGDEAGYELTKTNPRWLRELRSESAPSPLDVDIYRFSRLPVPLLRVVGESRRIMVVVTGDIERQNYHKLVSYYLYPQPFEGVFQADES